MIKKNVLIVGGGIAGLSTAYFLGKLGEYSVVILEREKDLGGHASGRNAGMLRQALADPILAALAKNSRDYFDTLSANGWKGLTLNRRGSLLLASGSDIAKLRSIAKTLDRIGVRNQKMSRAQIEKKVSLLKGGQFSEGLFCPSDAMLELEPLLGGFLRSLKKMGIPVLRPIALRGVKAVDGGFIVKAGNRLFFAKKIVNAAGAWASWVGEKAGASTIPLQPYRRHLFLSPNSQLRTPNIFQWPFVWDVSHDFYFRPSKKGLLLSPCDKTLETSGDRTEKTDPKMRTLLANKLKNFSEPLGRVRLGSALSGLRTMTPDGRFVVGEDPKRKGFYWVAGLGGHGVTTCFSVGRMAANIILGKKVDNGLKRALSPERFN